MNVKESQKYQMLSRVREFGARNPSAFPAGSHAAALLASVTSVVARLSSHSAAQAAGGDVVRAGTVNRAAARETLREDLEMVHRAAKAASRRIPALDGKFRVPQTMRAQALVDTARSFVSESAAFRAELAELTLDDAFFARLEADIAALEQALSSQERGRSTRKVAAAEIGAGLKAGLAAAGELDVIVRHVFRDNAAALADWESARRVRRDGAGGRPRKSHPKAGERMPTDAETPAPGSSELEKSEPAEPEAA